jgi:hypothetical protein
MRGDRLSIGPVSLSWQLVGNARKRRRRRNIGRLPAELGDSLSQELDALLPVSDFSTEERHEGPERDDGSVLCGKFFVQTLDELLTGSVLPLTTTRGNWSDE